MRFRHLKMNNHKMENIILIYNDTVLCNQRILYKSFALDEEEEEEKEEEDGVSWGLMES